MHLYLAYYDMYTTLHPGKTLIEYQRLRDIFPTQYALMHKSKLIPQFDCVLAMCSLHFVGLSTLYSDTW